MMPRLGENSTSRASPLEWERRYVHRIEDSRFGKTESQLTAQEMQVGQDGQLLLDALERSVEGVEGVERLKLESVDSLNQVWQQHFQVVAGGLRFKSGEELVPSNQRITSPYDTDATFAKKRNTAWEGYKVHITETCDSDQPHLITAVATTAATVADVSMGSLIQDYLEEHDLKPTEHLVDGGYVSAEYLLHSENMGIEVIGPPMPTSDWQSRVEGGLSLEHFQIDWDQKYAQCPAGKRSIRWLETQKVVSPSRKFNSVSPTVETVPCVLNARGPKPQVGCWHSKHERATNFWCKHARRPKKTLPKCVINSEPG